MLPRRYDCLNDLKRSEPEPPGGVRPMKEASRTEDPALPQNADPVCFGGKNDVLALGVS